MKKTIIFSIVSLLIINLLSCSDYLDINKDPRYPESAGTDLLFSSGITWTASRLGRDGELVGAIWAQHYTQNNSSNQYKDIDSYNINNSSTYCSGMWTAMYSGSLEDFKIAISQSEAGAEWNFWVASKIMTAFNYHVLASFFETIPCTEALQGTTILSPKYDDGKAVDASIIAMLDAAIAKKSDALAVAPAASQKMQAIDFVYKGDIDKWIKFAKTLKLKVLMRNFSANQTAIQTLLTEGDFMTADATLSQFSDAENYSNPLYESDRRKLNTANNIRGSATLVTFLNTYQDPRVAAFFEPATTNFDGTTAAPANTYRGLDQGSADEFTQKMFPTSAHSRARLAATDPVYFMSVVESYFLQAEAYARLGNTAGAKSKYDAGVNAAFSRWGYKAEPFIVTGGVYEFQSVNLDAMLKSILMQKWVAATRCQAWDAFFDICRTGIPALGTQTVNNRTSPSNPNPNYVVGTLAPSIYSVLPEGQFPRRLIFPKTSSDYNSNTPKTSDYPINKKMWWHK